VGLEVTGASVGAGLGAADCDVVGSAVVGAVVVGAAVGLLDAGDDDGTAVVGAGVGLGVGFGVGDGVGARVGDGLGEAMGDAVFIVVTYRSMAMASPLYVIPADGTGTVYGIGVSLTKATVTVKSGRQRASA
jgi:hypothetical protein